MLVQEGRDRGGVGDDAGDVGGGRERADLERAVGVLLELLAQVVLVDAAVGVLADRDDVGDRLAPRDLVGVVLVGPDEDDRALRRRDVLGERVGVVEGRGDPQPEDPDQLRDRPGAPGAGEQHDGVVVAARRTSRMIARASSRSRVVCRPVPLDSVWVLA